MTCYHPVFMNGSRTHTLNVRPPDLVENICKTSRVIRCALTSTNDFNLPRLTDGCPLARLCNHSKTIFQQLFYRLTPTIDSLGKIPRCTYLFTVYIVINYNLYSVNCQQLFVIYFLIFSFKGHDLASSKVFNALIFLWYTNLKIN